MVFALTALGVVVIAVTVLPLIRSGAWWIRINDFPRLQIAGLAVAVLLACLLRDEFFSTTAGRLFLSALVLCILYQSYQVFPFTPFARKQVQASTLPREESRLSLLFANVLMSNRNAPKLREIIGSVDPDIILTVEADEWWRQQLENFEQTHPAVVHQPQDNTYGMLLYSRLPLADPEVRFLVEDDIPSIHGRVRLPCGQEIDLHCLHPRPPFPTEDDDSTERDAELLIVGKAIKGKTLPVIVLGDLNDVAWSRTNDLFQNISGLLDPRVGRGFFNTFHARWFFLRFPLDHFFHSNHFRLIELRRLPYFGSDHFPVFISLSYEAGARTEQEKPAATGDEKEQARERIAKVT
ncbi:MAG TPA: endonuclease/exonuclease/phosphatase family protein [Burkholderiales bacterium]|nr:endonuclease/exonuclease/phosphatase family protein [Burkholderiales bacterium]